MSILTDAELVLGLSRHLAAYQMGPERAALEQLELAGQSFDVAFRLRGSTTSSSQRIRAIGLDVGLGSRALREVMHTMESLGWLTIQRDNEGQVIAVLEKIPAPADLVKAAGTVLDILLTTPAERAALALLRATSLQPLEIDEALSIAAEEAKIIGNAEAVEDAARYLKHTGLVREVTADDGRKVFYNPNVWTQGDEIAATALKAADAQATKEVGALLEEIAANPGMPESQVTATGTRWITFAVSQGLVQRSVIQTSEGNEKGFLFTPHLGRDPFGGTAGDASGQVRQLVGSMMYAATYAKYKLTDPSRFLRALINRGVAGDVTSIGTDYPMLEKAGIVRVIEGSRSNRFSLELLQSEVAEDALKLLSSGEPTGGDDAGAAALRAQRSYVHIEKERARLAHTGDTDKAEEARLIAALREIPATRGMGGI